MAAGRGGAELWVVRHGETAAEVGARADRAIERALGAGGDALPAKEPA
jgi:hypothetical protein